MTSIDNKSCSIPHNNKKNNLTIYCLFSLFFLNNILKKETQKNTLLFDSKSVTHKIPKKTLLNKKKPLNKGKGDNFFFFFAI